MKGLIFLLVFQGGFSIAVAEHVPVKVDTAKIPLTLHTDTLQVGDSINFDTESISHADQPLGDLEVLQLSEDHDGWEPWMEGLPLLATAEKWNGAELWGFSWDLLLAEGLPGNLRPEGIFSVDGRGIWEGEEDRSYVMWGLGSEMAIVRVAEVISLREHQPEQYPEAHWDEIVWGVVIEWAYESDGEVWYRNRWAQGWERPEDRVRLVSGVTVHTNTLEMHETFGFSADSLFSSYLQDDYLVTWQVSSSDFGADGPPVFTSPEGLADLGSVDFDSLIVAGIPPGLQRPEIPPGDKWTMRIFEGHTYAVWLLDGGIVLLHVVDLVSLHEEFPARQFWFDDELFFHVVIDWVYVPRGSERETGGVYRSWGDVKDLVRHRRPDSR